MSLRATVFREGHRHNSRKPFDLVDKVSKVKILSSSPGPSKSVYLKNNFMGDAQPKSGTESYFASPIRTLCKSVEDVEQDLTTDHDIFEAYNVLCTRIRGRKDEFSNLQNPTPFSIFTNNSSSLVQCISRDIRRVLPNPFESVPHRGQLSIYQSYDTDVSVNEDNLPISTEHMLCQHALRLMSDLFVFPCLYSAFSYGQISTLLQDAVSLCMPTTSRAFDIERLRSLVFLMLKTQQLPPSVLQSNVTSVVNALGCAITNVREAAVSKVDAFAATHSLMQRYPTLLPYFVPLLPLILRELNADELDVRLGAALAFSSFALRKVDTSFASFPCHPIAETILTYINEEHSRQKALPSDNLLPIIVKSAISNEDPFWARKGPSFAVTFSSTLMTLLDYRIFTSPHSLKLVFSVIRQACGKRRRNSIHTEMWKILIQAFSRIPRKVGDMKDPMAKEQDLDGWKDTREKAYRLVKQELKDGLGVACVVVLLPCIHDGASELDDVEKAIAIIEGLLKCEGRREKDDAALLLERLLGGIGSPTPKIDQWIIPEVRFSRHLVNGSLVGKTWNEFSIQPTHASVKEIRPLSEDEATTFWDRLSDIWISTVRELLRRSGDDLPPSIFETWQALLLVQGELTQSHQHLTTSPTFSSRVASIVTRFSDSLETWQAQTRYLGTTFELWTVMKNVFTKSWLPSPAERILASVLKKRFDLSNENVKTHWTRLCAELVSVGIPTLLHVLHTKRLSESQEEKELTRHLWAVLARNEGLGNDIEEEDGGAVEDDWLNLVHLLVMPFGAWDMDNSEVEIWKSALTRAIAAGTRVSQPSHAVISVMLDILGESKLPLLRAVPNALNILLSHLITSPCTTATIRILSTIDVLLHSSYSRTAEKSWSLDCLRLIGQLISEMLHSDIIKIISAMPNGLCKWIADEELVLADEEHREVVALYVESLKHLSAVEPSLDHLRVIANFLHSAFVRVHADGLVAFQKFWRSTYHQRKDIYKKDYPLAIRACLKAWSDVCDDSFADDISLGMESQSLESYTIPDSQPSPQKESGGGNQFIFGEIPPDLGMEANEDINSSSQGTVTAKVKEPLSFDNPGASVEDPSGFPIRGHDSQQVTILDFLSGPALSTSMKRPSDEEAPQTPKRRRIESDCAYRGDKHHIWTEQNPPWSSKGSCGRASISEPVTRTPSQPYLPPISYSQPSLPSHKRRREETPSWVGSDLKRLRRLMPSSDDYDTWEKGVLTGEPEAGESGSDDEQNTDLGSRAPSLGQFPIRPKRRDRSQTAPEPSIVPDSESVYIPRAEVLRRHRTSPPEDCHKKTSSAQLDALQQAYAVITDTGTSQIDMQEIMHARRLANQINQVLDEQMCLKFGAQQDDSGDCS